jgi:BirA family biotin operon repressor/biotin-[acetyl-CoA-carboxylase] ligase
MDAGLYLSIVLRPRLELNAWPLITLMTALAVRDALSEACALDVDIKWPNDIYAAERKLCGILAETVETETGRACIVGIGLNLREQAFPAELQSIATSIESVTRAAPDTEALLGALLRALWHRYEMLQAPDGKSAILLDWSSSSSYAEGRRVRVSLGDEMIEGITRGLECDGALRVETDAGEIKTVRAGDVTAVRARMKERD